MDDAIKALRLGAFDYLQKPLEDRELLTHSIKNGCRLNELNKLSHNFDTKLEETVFKQTKIIKQEFEARRIAESELQEVKDELQFKLLHSQKLESIGQLAAGIAHEINTPIQFLCTNYEFLSETFGDLSVLIGQYRSFVALTQKEAFSAERVNTILKQEEDLDINYLLEEIPQALSQGKRRRTAYHQNR